MFKKISLPILFSLFLLIPALVFAQEASEKDAFLAAKGAYDGGSYGASLSLFEKFVKDFPGSKALFEVQLYIGQCLFQNDRFSEARDVLIKLEKDYVPYGIEDRLLFWLGQTYLKVKDFSQASEYFQKLIKMHPDSSLLFSSKMQLGWICLQQGEFEEAQNIFDTLTDSEDAVIKEEALFKKGELQFQAKDYNGALVSFGILSELFLNSDRLADAYFYMGETSFYLNDFKKAVEYYSKALEKSNSDLLKAESLQGVAWSYLNSNELGKAEGTFSKLEELIKEDFNRESLFLGRAILYSRLKRPEEALAYYDRLIKEYPDSELSIQAFFGKAECLSGLSRFDNAIDAYKEVIYRGVNKDDDETKELVARAHYNLGSLYFKKDDFESAILQFRKLDFLSVKDETRLSALYYIAEAYQNMKEFDKANEVYQDIIKNYPVNSYNDYVLYQLGLSQMKSGQLDSAILSFKNFNKRFNQSEFLDDVNYYLCFAYYSKDDLEMASHQLSRFIEAFPKSIYTGKAIYLLAVSFYKREELDEAIYYYDKILKDFQKDEDLVQKAEYEIAKVFYQMGDEESALRRFKQFIKSHPKSSIAPNVIFWLGQYYQSNSQYELSRKDFETLVRMYPKHKLAKEATYQIGLTILTEGRYNEAQQIFERLLDESIQQELRAKTMLAIGDSLFQKGEKDKAIEIYNKLTLLVSSINIDSKVTTKSGQENKLTPDTVAYDKQAPLISDTVIFESEADEKFNLNGSGVKFAKLAYMRLGDIYNENKQFSEAISFYNEALKLPQDEISAQIQFKVAETYEENNDLSAALNAYLNIVSAYEEDKAWIVKGLLRSSLIYEDRDDWQAAIKTYEIILDYDVPEAKYAQERLVQLKKQVK